jgi:hypothetical protein
MSRIQIFLLVEGLSFGIASLIHSGRLIQGYAHPQARIAESVIAAVLFGGLILTWIRPGSLRQVGIAAQGLALLGTLIGVFTIIVGVGPSTLPDIVYHIGIILVLGWGLRVATAWPRAPAR